MSLRWRVALALAALAAATTISVGIIGYVTTRDRLVEEIDRSLTQVTASLDYRRGGIRVPERGLLDVYVQVIDRAGEPVPSPAGASFAPGDESAEVLGHPGDVRIETVQTDYGDLRVRTEALGFGGAVQVARSMEETDAVLADVRWRTLLLVVVVTALAALLGWILAGSVAGPLVRLTKAATDVERSGRLDVEVPVSGPDEVGRLGTAFNGMLGALAASRAEQQRLVEDAGHELRTPLTSLRTNVAVLRRHRDIDEATREQVLSDLHQETEELVGLVEEVVALAKGVNDDLPVTEVALGPVARTVAARSERRHGRPVTVVDDGSIVRAVGPVLERAVSNLVDNAAKFDHTGGPIVIEIAAGALTVHDRGPGIAAGDQEQVFHRFYRAEAARSQPGSGLGLSIVREVAERFGGTTSATNRPGGGASVGFQLPLWPAVPGSPTVTP